MAIFNLQKARSTLKCSNQSGIGEDEVQGMKMTKFVLFLSLLLAAGCSSLAAQRVHLSLERPKECQAFLTTLDESADQAGVRDAASYPVPGFPYLRTNRFLSHLKHHLRSEQESRQWSRWMQKLDLESRKREIGNLPDNVVSAFFSEDGKPSNHEQLYEKVTSCSDRLFQHDEAQAAFSETLVPFVEVPDEYSFSMRALGLYPLVAIPVAMITHLSRQKVRSWYEMEPEALPVDGRLKAFVPPDSPPLSMKEVQDIIEVSSRNPPGVPAPDEHLGKKLVEHFAPVFVQDVSAPYDRIGRMVWNGDCPDVDPTRPTVYYYLSNAYLKGKPILQINYVIWYSARNGKRAPRIEWGHLDGLTLRVSLDEGGRPFMVDIMNDCGCYHLFAPAKERLAGVISKPFRFDPFVPQGLPDLGTGERLGARLNSGWHQVERLIAVKDFPDSIRYELAPYEILEALSREEGRMESIFNSRGIAKCSERSERFLLFSMGIPKIGSMRQRGHHAIELIGRAQFDDPDLFDESFLFK
jgi:hypothetical protein